jgi:hypothetical protein
VIGGTPQLLEDPRRGLYSDPHGSVALQKVALSKLALRMCRSCYLARTAHERRHFTTTATPDGNLCGSSYQPAAAYPTRASGFLRSVTNRVGAETLLTPGEVVRDFIGVLNILQQNPQMTLNQVVHSSTFQPSKGA